MSSHKKNLQLIDLTVFATEFGVYLTWFSLLTDAAVGPNATFLVSGIWAGVRFLRVVFIGLIGNFVDSREFKVPVFRLSMLFYALVLLVYLFVLQDTKYLGLLFLGIIPTFFNQTTRLARTAYVRGLLDGPALRKQVSLIENLPLVASGLSAAVLFYFSSSLSLETAVIVDLILHVLCFLILTLKKEWGETKEESFVAYKWSASEEWRALKRVMGHMQMRRIAFNLYFLYIAFGSYPVLVNAFSGTSLELSKTIYSSYAFGVAVGSLISLIIAQSGLRVLALQLLTPVLFFGSLVQVLYLYPWGFDKELLTFFAFVVGTVCTYIFTLYLTESRATLVSLCNKNEVATNIAATSRFEHLVSAVLAATLGGFAKLTSPFIASLLPAAFIIPLLLRKRE